MSNQDKKVTILGAGVAGIGAGHRHGQDAVIYEARDSYGGLCDNFMVGGFRFDTAVHLSFAKEKLVRDVFDQVPYYAHQPIAENYCDGYWAKHPLQNNTFKLPVEEKLRIIKSIMDRQPVDPIDNYEKWLVNQFGEYFAQKYPMRYTRKYWCCEAREMSVDWIVNRMYMPSIDEVLLGAMTDQTPNTYYAAEMRYPKQGGYKAFFSHIADKMDIRLNHQVIQVDTKEKVITFANGGQAGYDKLISSIPLPVLVKAIPQAPEHVRLAAGRLPSSSVTIVSLGYNKVIKFPSLWFYVYDEDILFARGYSPSMKAPANAPEGKSSLQFEIYQSRDRKVEMPDDEIVRSVIQSLEKMGISSPDDIEASDIRHLPYGNIVFKQGMEEDRSIVLDFVRGAGIVPVGRFGHWEYYWSNQAFVSGYEADI